MLYAIIASDKAGSLPTRLSARPAHLERLRALQDAGRLILAGPHPAIDCEDPGEAGFRAALSAPQLASPAPAPAGAAADPYTQVGVFAQVEVKPFRKVFPA